MNVQQRVNEIITRHCVWMTAQIAQIECAMTGEPGIDRLRATQLGELRELVHQMTGSSGTVGFAEIGRTAALLEDHLVELMQSDGHQLSEHDASQLVGLLRDLKQMIAEARPETSTLYRQGAA